MSDVFEQPKFENVRFATAFFSPGAVGVILLTSTTILVNIVVVAQSQKCP